MTIAIAGVEVSPDHFIGGERVASDDDVHRHLADRRAAARPRSPAAGEREADLAVAAATEAFPAWAALGAGGPRRSTCTGSPT